MPKIFSPNKLHGKVINYNKIKNLPSRKAFLEKDIYNEVNDIIKQNKPLLFMPNHLQEMSLQEKKYEKAMYKIVLYGVLVDGRSACVVISGIKPSFDVMIDDPEDAVKLNTQISQLKYGAPHSYEIVKGKPFKGYSRQQKKFVRFYFSKIKNRRNALDYVKSKNYETASDDLNSYYRVVCRDYLTTFSSWVTITDYDIREYSRIRGVVFDVNIKNYKAYGDIMNNPRLTKDNIMSCCWDIETFSPDGRLPRPNNPDHKMFMIGITFQWHHANTQLLRVCLVEHPCNPRPNYLTIVCGTEKKIIKAYGKLVYKMRPDLYLGFNDADYDWPWLIIRANMYEGTLAFLASCFDRSIHWKNYDDADVFKYNFKKQKIKLEADTYATGQTLEFPGYLSIDVRTMFRQLYPTAEKSSLNFYLQLNKLQSKKDMPYAELFRIYSDMSELMKKKQQLEEKCGQYNAIQNYSSDIFEYIHSEQYTKLMEDMADVADYCVIDSQRCHELMKMRSVLMDRREVANLSYTSLFDAIYRANGMKVRNIVIARGQTRGLKFSNITNSGYVEDGKYPGAYVFPPKKGLVTSKLTINDRRDLCATVKYEEWADISDEQISQFYHIIRKYGASPKMEDLAEIRAEGHPACFIKFLEERIGRPVTGLDFSSLYPSLIMTYNLSPEYIITNKKDAMQAHNDGHTLYKIKFTFNGRVIRGWSIRHDNKIDPSKEDCKFGIYPMILKELFDTRKLMKKDLHKYESQKEKLEALPQEEFAKSETQKIYEDVCFNYNYTNSKQKALKVFMNTFYGESGNKRSPFFVLQLAGAITTAGQDNIKMVQKHLENEQCTIYYGDSVTADTPLILRDATTQMVYIKTIDDLVAENAWESYEQFKPGEPDRIQKQQGQCSYQIWSEGDWREIRRVIRHKTNKKMFRVNTHTGCIDVTEDHSLMRPDRTKIKPTELQIGTELMHSFPEEFPEVKLEKEEKYDMIQCTKCDENKPKYEFYKNRTTGRLARRTCRKCCWQHRIDLGYRPLMTEYFSHHEYLNVDKPITKEEAYVWGFFMADGSCGNYQCTSGIKRSWAINNQNIRYLNQAKEYLAICEPYLKFKLIDTLESSGVYKLIAQGFVKLIVEKYRKLFYAGKYKIVPARILNASLAVRRSFYDGYYVGDGCKTSEQNANRQDFCCKGKITSQCMYYLVKSLGYKYATVSTRADKPDIYRISVVSKRFGKNPIAVKKISNLPEVNQETFVYDIETSQGSFSGGVGALNPSNTDSCYSSMPEESFRELDVQYYTGEIPKEQYWKSMVDTTFDVIKRINTDVNQMLIEDNGTKFLKMAYEEALYPCAFLAKKKYYGIPHISIPNFRPKKLFIRGLEVKKRGVSGMLKKVCMGIMWDSVSLMNHHTLMELVENKIDNIYTTDWDFTDFIKTDVFRPNRQNIKMQTFAARMKEIGIMVKPHERFQYVIVKKNPYRYDHRGRTLPLKVGDKMEYIKRAQEKQMEIDLDYYVKQSVVGQLARLVTYSPLFHVEPESHDADDLKTADDKIYQNAVKYVNNYCKQYYTNYNSKGRIYQKIFRVANKAVLEEAKNYCAPEVVSIIGSNYNIDELCKWLEEKAEKKILREIRGYGEDYITGELDKVETTERRAKLADLQDIYFARKKGSLIQMRERAFKERREALIRQVNDNLDAMVGALKHHTKAIQDVSGKLKQLMNIDNLYNEVDAEIPTYQELATNINIEDVNKSATSAFGTILENDDIIYGLNKLQYIYLNMISNYHFIHKTRSIVDYLKQCRNRGMGFQARPETFDPKKFIKNSVDSMIEDMKNKGLGMQG